MKRNDILLAAAVLMIAGLIWFSRTFFATEDPVVTIRKDGELFGTYSLDTEQTIEVDDSNRVVISDGSVRVEWADCPDQICVRHRPIDKNGESIICLPNRIVISVENSEESGIDGMTR